MYLGGIRVVLVYLGGICWNLCGIWVVFVYVGGICVLGWYLCNNCVVFGCYLCGIWVIVVYLGGICVVFGWYLCMGGMASLGRATM